MKKIYLILIAIIFISKSVVTAQNDNFSANIDMKATNTFSTFFIAPNPGCASWSSTLVTVNVNDVVTFGAGGTCPLVEVSQATWMANGTASLVGGFGIKNTSYSFTITALTSNTIYFASTANGNAKGRIVKAGSTGISSISNLLTQVSLFPNPVSDDEIKIITPSNLNDVTLKLINVNGQEIELSSSSVQASQSSVITAVLPISIDNGVYFIEVSTANERVYKKVVITK
ncbi:MAG: T9SS type A sorting domain-containing protein [Bacteroidota bacterium]|nr:T9SS type A sorting domain-containing protein [Bacteroidota bacterium]